MAKGNLFLGTAARSVGDVVMYRREGSQVSRVRVRKIANPKTDAQCEQRAFMSAVVKYYQPLANVLDRSWQGLSRAKSYAKFLKTNVGIVRSKGLYFTKDAGWKPLPLQLSNGTLPSIGVAATSDSSYIMIDMSGEGAQAPTTVKQASDLFIAQGYKNGDVITIIAPYTEDGVNWIPYSGQFIINTGDAGTPLANTMGNIEFVKDITSDYLAVQVNGSDLVGLGCIISRSIDGVWNRTKSFMALSNQEKSKYNTPEAKAAAIASYKGAAASDNPLVYLDGDELDNA